MIGKFVGGCDSRRMKREGKFSCCLEKIFVGLEEKVLSVNTVQLKFMLGCLRDEI